MKSETALGHLVMSNNNRPDSATEDAALTTLNETSEETFRTTQPQHYDQLV